VIRVRKGIDECLTQCLMDIGLSCADRVAIQFEGHIEPFHQAAIDAVVEVEQIGLPAAVYG